MTDIACFMVETCNERTVTRAGKDGSTHDENVFDVRRVDSGEVLKRKVEWMVEGGLPVGAMWWADIVQKNKPTGPDDWPPDRTIAAEEWTSGNVPAGIQLVRPRPDAPRRPSSIFADGPHLCVWTPAGQWNIDSRASNCTQPYDYAHRCWVRHGEPPMITVDKNGLTCAAGAGSIQCGSYHGFLRDGHLTDCP